MWCFQSGNILFFLPAKLLLYLFILLWAENVKKFDFISHFFSYPVFRFLSSLLWLLKLNIFHYYICCLFSVFFFFLKVLSTKRYFILCWLAIKILFNLFSNCSVAWLKQVAAKSLSCYFYASIDSSIKLHIQGQYSEIFSAPCIFYCSFNYFVL